MNDIIKQAQNMPSICSIEGLAFPRADGKHIPIIPFSLKLEGQDWQCIFQSFPQGAERITNALPLGAERHGFSCTSPCFQFIMEDSHCPDNFKN